MTTRQIAGSAICPIPSIALQLVIRKKDKSTVAGQRRAVEHADITATTIRIMEQLLNNAQTPRAAGKLNTERGESSSSVDGG